ncbi:MAG: conjugative transfer signal peptidase TraF [Candidatus Eremiobacteraeota bacterium]|nr:conjugative transfer signal peptidase TraF [Candidatus Eremiobacteraeota bacterium]MBC5826873.1 conjugative transfer signal peptidase TraF [Candidatus Eremiobacteraeota bacterium]
MTSLSSQHIDARKEQRQTRAAIFSSGIFLMLTTSTVISAGGLRVNFTESMPQGLYKVVVLSRRLNRGDLVSVCAPSSAATLGRQRGYLATGECVGGSEPLLKIVAALSGDRVLTGPSGVTVNGSLLPHTNYLSNDAMGRPMQRWPSRYFVMGPRTIWLYAPFWRSWDSRYWGPVEVSSVLGIAVPVFVFTRSD